MSKLKDPTPEITEALTKALNLAGLFVEGEAKRRCAVDTGNLRASINSQTEGLACYIGTNVEYAPFVEEGTCKMDAQPFLMPAIDENRDTILRMFEGIL